MHPAGNSDIASKAGADLGKDLLACEQIIREGSKSFYAASHLLPADTRAAAFALYAFCREADDAVDRGCSDVLALSAIRRRLAAAYSGQRLDTSVDRAFSWVVSAYDIPISVPKALIEGFEFDVDGRRYRTLDDLKGYAARVASAVGVMMALVMGARSREALARACDLGMAMQLTNIARDVGEDARAGRCYIPTDWLSEVGLRPESLAALGAADQRVRSLVARLLGEAKRLYVKGTGGIHFLPAPCRPAIRAAAAIYAEIGSEIAKAEYDTISRRASVSKSRKFALVAKSFLPQLPGASADFGPADPACAFLIDPIGVQAPRFEAPRPGTASWAIDLFLRLEQRDLQTGAR